MTQDYAEAVVAAQELGERSDILRRRYDAETELLEEMSRRYERFRTGLAKMIVEQVKANASP